LLEKSAKVKPVSARVLALQAEAAAASVRTATNLKALKQVRETDIASAKKTKTPVRALVALQVEFGFQHGFSTFIKRKVLASRASAATADDAQAAAAGVAAQPLGNNTESQAAFSEVRDEETGEIQRLRYVSRRGENVLETYSDFGVINARAARFSAQSSAARLLHDERTPRGTQWRVTGCSRRKIAAEVAILYSHSIKKAHFGGLMICGSVWTCPPCAAKVSERRKNEVVAATDLHKSQGGGLYLVTLTCSHKRHDKLDEWLKKFSAAKVKMRQWRAYKDIKLDVGYVGDVRAMEVTFGDANGWHPHEHGLWLTEKRLSVRKLEAMSGVRRASSSVSRRRIVKTASIFAGWNRQPNILQSSVVNLVGALVRKWQSSTSKPVRPRA
jgi:hypothetical protein